MARVRREAKISKEITEFLTLIGHIVYSTEQGYRPARGGTRMSPGIPDLLVFGTPELPFYFVEVKAPGGKMRGSQRAFQSECERMSVPHLVAWDVRDVFDWLVEHGVIETTVAP